MKPSPEVIQLAINFENKLKEDIATLEERVKRIKNTYNYLKNSSVRQVRLMIGDFTPVVICDSIFPIKKIKAEYLERLEHSLRLWETKLLVMKEEYKKLTQTETNSKKGKILRTA